MANQQTRHNTCKKEILFANGHHAQLIAPMPGTPAGSILEALSIQQPEALVILTGGAAGLDESLKPCLVEMFSHGIAGAVAGRSTVIIDGGTQVGVMAMMGQGIADRGADTNLLGVAPAGKVTYPGGPTEECIEDGAPLDPNHTHFVLVESSEWGSETEIMYEIANELSKTIPVLTILVNGGNIAEREVLLSVRHGWTIIVIEGTGRLADEIAAAIREETGQFSEEVKTIAGYNRITLLDINEGPEALARLIRQKLFGEPET